ncbi:MAG TPA: GNAT family N-acetyltransferase [Gaiellaceae bacterium]|nr:GNAT family N-acetyltransferase [Gaiellaceae bacterium]
MPIVLETERLTLTPIDESSLDAFAVFMADPEVMRFIGGETLDRNEVEIRLGMMRERFERDGFGHFVLTRKADGRIVGRAGLLVWTVPEWTITTRAEAQGDYEIELGWTLGREFWGHGYATEAARAIQEFAFGELGLDRLISLIDPENVASVAVARRLGMEIEGAVELPKATVQVWATRPVRP